MTTPLIILAICTYKRPQMLRSCLESVKQLDAPENFNIAVCVVDNEVSDLTASIVHDVGEGEFHYLPQPDRGIVHARNMALDWAVEKNAVWFTFLDDDQTVPSNWLVALLNAQRLTHAEVLQSAVKYISPKGNTLKKAKASWNQNLKYVSTNGVLFTTHLIRSDGLGLRFDARFNMSGCSDRFLFLQARQKGVRCVATPEAIAIELTPDTRIGLKATFKRTYKQNWINTYQDVDLYGYIAAFCDIAKRVMSALYKGTLSLSLGLLTVVFDYNYGKRKLHKAARNYGTLCGTLRGLVAKKLPQAYLQTHGG
ncbi:glycosyltransferase family 2 protein [Celeribacter sp. ULVN23_4]